MLIAINAITVPTLKHTYALCYFLHPLSFQVHKTLKPCSS